MKHRVRRPFEGLPARVTLVTVTATAFASLAVTAIALAALRDLFPSQGLAWGLVFDPAPDETAAPAAHALRHMLLLDLGVVVALSLGAYGLATSVVRPIEALSRAARRLRDGETDVEIPVIETRDEVGMLTQAFHDMKLRLDAHSRELEASQENVERANERLRIQNSDLQRANQVLEQLSITDGLTQLHNHRYFQDQIVREVKRVNRTNLPLCLLLFDIDHFKGWNDRLGHVTGDQILRSVADVMSAQIRQTDILARYGGEEFAVLAPGTDLEGARVLAEKIRMAIEESASVPSPPGAPEDRVTVSAGVAAFAGDRERMFAAADAALYAAKDQGRNRTVVAGPGPDDRNTA